MEVQIVDRPAERLSRRSAGRGVVLDLGRHRRALADHRLGMIHCEIGDLFGDWLAFSFVGVEDRRWRPALEVCREQPAQILGIGHPSIQAVAAVRHPDVGRVATQKRPSVTEAVRHQAPTDPVLFAEQLVMEVGSDAENGPNPPVPIDSIKVYSSSRR